MRPVTVPGPAEPAPRSSGLGLLGATGAVALVHLAVAWALSEILVRDTVQRPVEAMVGMLVPPAPLPADPPKPLPPPPTASPRTAPSPTAPPPTAPPKPKPRPDTPRPDTPAKVAPPSPIPAPDVESPPSERAVTLPPPHSEAPPAPPAAAVAAPPATPGPPAPPAPAASPAPGAPPASAAPAPLPVTPPRADAAHLNNPAPVYPALSRRLGEQGRVLIDVRILADGSVGHIRLNRSSGFPRLDQAALEAVRHWRYLPARRGGEPIPYWYVQPIEFSLDS